MDSTATVNAANNNAKNQWSVTSIGFALLRTPLMEHTFLHNKQVAPSQESKAPTPTEALKASIENIAALVRSELVGTAIRHASPSLSERVGRLDIHDVGPANIKLATTIYKYLSRMSRRCTPFGLMAATSLVKIADSTCLNARDDIRLNTRLDNRLVLKILHAFNADLGKTSNESEYLRQNNMMHAFRSQVRRITVTDFPNNPSYSYVTTSLNKVLSRVLASTRGGISRGRLVNIVRDMVGDEREASIYIDKLIEHQVLVRGYDIALTEGDTFASLVRDVKASGVTTRRYYVASHLNRSLTRITSAPQLALAQRSGYVLAMIKSLCNVTEDDNVMHVDAYRPMQSDLVDGKDVLALLSACQSILPFTHTGIDHRVKQFVDEFRERYGEREEVPLLEALDPDTGVSFGPQRSVTQELLDGVVIGAKQFGSMSPWRRFDSLILDCVIDAISRGNGTAILDPEKLEDLVRSAAQPVNVDQTGIVHATLFRRADVEGAPLWLLRSISGGSAAALLGRFSCGDQRLAWQLRKMCKEEQAATDALLAEVVHVDDGVTANVATRSRLRSNEIIYGAVRPSAGTNAFRADDLMVRIIDGFPALRSRSKNVYVLPQLASAHNTYGFKLPVYQFLAALQYGKSCPVGFALPAALENAAYVPRIQLGDVVLSPARWRLGPGQLRDLGSACDEGGDSVVRAVSKLRRELGLPRFATVSYGTDNKLELDFDDAVGAVALASEAKRRNVAIIEEAPQCMGSPCITSLDGRTEYCNELCVPVRMKFGADAHRFTTVTKRGPRGLSVKDGHSCSNGRTREQDDPLGRWIYYKIYTGKSTADQLLMQRLAPCAERMKKKGLIDKWFFVRYEDGKGSHLRFRVHSIRDQDRLAICGEIRARLQSPLREGLVSDIFICNYKYEIKRYGGPAALRVCERLFHIGSSLISKALEHLYSRGTADDRWVLAFVLAWDTIAHVVPDVDGLISFADDMCRRYEQEMEFPRSSNAAVSRNYRKHKHLIDEACTNRNSWIYRRKFGFERTMSDRARLMRTLSKVCREASVIEVAASLIHMDCNRVFAFRSRANEMLVYHYVSKFGRSVRAKGLSPLFWN